MENKDNILDSFEEKKINRRRLLPWWMKIFCWLFMFFGIAAIACLALGLLGYNISLAFYGFETNRPFSIVGLIIIIVAIFKGITAFSLWFEADYAITLGLNDAILGILLCIFSMFIMPSISDVNFRFRGELLLLIPYLLRLNKIKNEWNQVSTPE